MCDDGFDVDGAHSACGAADDDGAKDDTPSGCAEAGTATTTFSAALLALCGAVVVVAEDQRSFQPLEPSSPTDHVPTQRFFDSSMIDRYSPPSSYS